MNDEVETKRARVKRHLSENKRVYLATVGSSAITYIVLRRFGGMAPAVAVSAVQKANNTIGDISESIVTIDQSLNIYQQFGGYACKILQDTNDPSKMWPKIKDFCDQMAEEHNTKPEQVRRLLERFWAGKLDNVYGYEPVRYGVTTAS